MASVSGVVVWLAMACSAVSCTVVVTPPPQPEHPTTVFVLREALHLGLVLPSGASASEPGFVEFGFGEWSWYALGNEAWYRVFPVVLWPTAGTLCRRTFAARDEAALQLHCAQTGRELDAMQVDGRAVATLREQLNAQFDATAAHDGSVQRPELGMEFVLAGESYWFARTCADVAARWCEQLGCEVGWIPIRGSLAVRKD
jgi:hypothetical protein